MFFFQAKQKQKVHRFPCMGGGSVMMPVTRILTFLAQEIWWIFIISSHFLGGCKFEHLNQSMILLFAAFIFRNSNRWHLFRSKKCFVAKWERSGSALSQTWNCPRKSCWETSQKVLSLKWRPSPQTCTSGCQGWCAASARSCPAWWCAPCGWHCQSGLGAPASGSWKWMLYDQDVNVQLKTLIIYWGWNGVELKFWIGMQGWGG